MPDERIEDRVKRLMVERFGLSVKPEEIGEEAPLVDLLGMESWQILEILIALEEVFGVSMQDEEFRMENFATVKAIAGAVRRKQAI